MKMPDFSKIIYKINKLTPAQKKFFTAIAVFIIVDLAAVILICATKSRSAVHLECYGRSEMSSLVALDTNAQSGVIKSSSYANFKFTKAQKEMFSEIFPYLSLFTPPSDNLLILICALHLS